MKREKLGRVVILVLLFLTLAAREENLSISVKRSYSESIYETDLSEKLSIDWVSLQCKDSIRGALRLLFFLARTIEDACRSSEKGDESSAFRFCSEKKL